MKSAITDDTILVVRFINGLLSNASAPAGSDHADNQSAEAAASSSTFGDAPLCEKELSPRCSDGLDPGTFCGVLEKKMIDSGRFAHGNAGLRSFSGFK